MSADGEQTATRPRTASSLATLRAIGPALVFVPALAGLILWHAWVYEDAYITFRVIDNLVDGYGLRWNVDERVQVFTHPLWLLVHVPFVYALGNPYLVCVALSFVFAVGAVLVSLRALSGARPSIIFAFLLSLTFAESFLLYGTSGFETPLSFFLFAAFVATLGRGRDVPWLGLALITALAGVNRLDTLLLYLPIWAFLLFSDKRFSDKRLGDGGRVSWRGCLLGGTPLLLWELFSLAYFGFAFPNTKYAKLDTGIPFGDVLAQGFRYARDLLQTDPSSAALIALALVASAVAVARWHRERGDHDLPRAAALGLGIAGYCAYVVYIGGDFMSLRHWSLPAFASALVLARVSMLLPERRRMPDAVIAVVLLLATVEWFSPSWLERDETSGIAEQYELYPTNRLSANLLADGVATHRWSRAGAAARQASIDAGSVARTTSVTIGMYGYHAGPSVIIIDAMALADPLLARLPTANKKEWRIGHFRRAIPQGYEAARFRGDLSQMDPALAEYYTKLKIITRGPLFSWDRLGTIVGFHLGRYDSLRRQYLERVARSLPDRTS